MFEDDISLYAHFFLIYLRFKNNQNYQFHKENSNYFITTLSNFNLFIHVFLIDLLKKICYALSFFFLFVLVLWSFQVSQHMVFDEPLCIVIL